MPFTFAMVLPEGKEVGRFATSEPAWQVGDEVLVRPGTVADPVDRRGAAKRVTLHAVWEVERLA